MLQRENLLPQSQLSVLTPISVAASTIPVILPKLQAADYSWNTHASSHYEPPCFSFVNCYCSGFTIKVDRFMPRASVRSHATAIFPEARFHIGQEEDTTRTEISKSIPSLTVMSLVHAKLWELLLDLDQLGSLARVALSALSDQLVHCVWNAGSVGQLYAARLRQHLPTCTRGKPSLSVCLNHLCRWPQ